MLSRWLSSPCKAEWGHKAELRTEQPARGAALLGHMLPGFVGNYTAWDGTCHSPSRNGLRTCLHNVAENLRIPVRVRAKAGLGLHTGSETSSGYKQ